MNNPNQPRYTLRQDFRYFHEPLQREISNTWVVGRRALARALADRIMLSRGGAFLVTGLRGVGKTTFVYLTMHLIENERDRLRPMVGDFRLVDVWINLARPLDPTQLMHHLIRHLCLRLRETRLFASLEPNLQEDLERAFLRTSFEISSRTLVSEERGREASVGFDRGPWLGLEFLGKLSSSYKKSHSDEEALKYLPFDEKAAEFEILSLSRRLAEGIQLRKEGWAGWLNRLFRRPAPRAPIKVIFVLDELDKLEQSRANERTRSSLDPILEALKTVFTATEFSFIFIGGKEVQERLIQDVAHGDSIYESIFAYDLYLPCLWEEQKQLLNKCLERDDQKGVQTNADELQMLQLYLEYKGRGVPRRTWRELNKFVVWDGSQPVLTLDIERRRYMEIFAKLQETLRREEIFGTQAQAFEHAHFDRQRLCLYYALDWIFNRGHNLFTAAQIQEAAQSLNLGPGSELASTHNVAEKLVRLLLDRAFIERVIQENAQIGVPSAQPLDQYRLSPWVILAFQAVPEKQWVPEEAQSTQPVAAAPEFQSIGPYRVLGKIGSGGFGEVYRVADQAGRVVAAKILHAALAFSPEARTRFEREMEILRQLQHPNIVRIYAHGVERERLYFVMDFISGVSVRGALAALKPFPPEWAVGIAKQLSEVFAYVHGRGIVRNDIKPSNVLLTDEGSLRIVDFGIAKTLGRKSNTETGVFVGTPGYMAPEQIQGNPADARSDIFSLGVVLYEMLTGESPFRAESQVAEMIKVINQEPLPPSRLVSVSAELEAAVMKALAKDPQLRFQSMREFAEALDELAEPVDLAETVRRAKSSSRIADELDAQATRFFSAVVEDTALSVLADGGTASSPKEGAADVPSTPRAEPPPPPMGYPPLPSAPAGEGLTTRANLFDILQHGDPEARQKVFEELSRLNPPGTYDLLFVFAQQICYFLADKVQSAALNTGRLTLGRSESSADLVIKSSSVSRQHVAFFFTGDNVEAEDLGSPNGIYVNGNRCRREILHSGDVLRVGGFDILVHIFAAENAKRSAVTKPPGFGVRP